MALFGIIPARYASTRFPGKPLARIKDKPMIQWVYERAKQSDLQKVVVATDDDRIRAAVLDFGGEAVMTSPDHASGTERCAEAAAKLNLSGNDIVVNIQGDEPFIQPDAINLLCSQFTQPQVQIATLCKQISPEEDPANPNMVKVVRSSSGKALYFSRSAIPYYRNDQIPPAYFKHIGIYAYRLHVLQQLVLLPVSSYEDAEKLEQLRWLENDYDIYVRPCSYETVAIDTPQDLVRAESMSNLL
ncbi:MAG: 3-deoxy-manno-octulosonate cytidylyltransferase [Bacteroidales bacterium]|nr:3-deoxy-manno-octulosonate cytidylyltransferase [Bacteroidales bacterium]